MKVKILGMALLALAATSALAATNASGEPSGHFYHHAVGSSAAITAHSAEGTAHQLQFTRLKPGTHEAASANPISCKTSQYTSHVTARTVTSIQLYPKYTECTTVNDGTSMTLNPNHCSHTFLSQGIREHGTVIVTCPEGKVIEVAHPNCGITVPPQTTASTLTEGISYTNLANGTITANVTVNTITAHFHTGICVFLGTNQKFEMKGSVTVEGFEYINGSGTEHTLNHGAKVAITST
jgi:hypothetical protein